MPDIHWQRPNPKSVEQLSLDPAMPGAEKASVTLMYPNGTTVVIKGDPHIVKQIVNRLDDQTIEYVALQTKSEQRAKPTKEEFCHFVELEKNGTIGVLHVSGCAAAERGKESAPCAFMRFLEAEPVERLKKLMPKPGDYEAVRINDRYMFTSFKKPNKE